MSDMCFKTLFSVILFLPLLLRFSVYKRHHASLSDRRGHFMVISQKKFKNKSTNRPKQKKIKVELMDESINKQAYTLNF